jgi:pyruvate dehydrogenase (quinone)
MAQNVADHLIDRLREWGITRIFGYPGDGINGILGALDRAEDKIEFVQVRHEEMAAFMACGHAKFTGDVGVCLATSGPGAIHLLNGLYDAKLDHAPVVAIVGQQDRRALGGDYQQEVDLLSLFKDVASEYVQMATVPDQIRHLVDRAVRIAKDRRTVTCIVLPNDLQEMDAVTEPAHDHGTVHSSAGYSPPLPVPVEDQIHRAADVLNAGSKVAMLIGAGARHAEKEVEEVAELLGAGVAKALLGRAVLDDFLPYVTGAIGLLGTKPSWDMIGIRYPTEVNLVGDSKATLERLIPLLERKQDRGWREGIESGVEEWWRLVEARALNDANPINPQRVFWELSSRLPDGAILTADSGSGTNWFARDLRLRGGMMASLSGNLATMGCAVPYAIGAKFAFPSRPVIALVGDGAMQMNGMAELITIAKYYKRWSDPRLVVLVLNNRDLNQVTWEQRALAGDPKFEATQTIPDVRYAAFADLIGLKGIYVDDPDIVGSAWEEALSADRPTVLEAVTDPEVPPLPPHVKYEQAKNLAEALLKGDPETKQVVKQGLKEKIEEFIPRN